MSQPRPLNEVYAHRRQAMVLEQLAPRGITDTRVLAAMARVPREEYVSSQEREMAYCDGALPIGREQTISQPYTVAFMCQAAQLQPGDRVLEIGTGSGYGAAVLAQLAGEVHTIERIEELAKNAQENLARCGYHNVTVHLGDGTLGLPPQSPFNAIMVTAGATGLPEAYRQQLADGGRIVIPIGVDRRSQTMFCFTRRGDQWESQSLGGFAFVPLIGQGAMSFPDR
ncbi:MAG: protein-L-isoaspartate(D-aspartate) O-methyltransferase [Planctomycetes bacterium]|nr:protein-L-isoaspartate(D-aspartate) O-methyltransferase [Planctomycetota bacterium]